LLNWSQVVVIEGDLSDIVGDPADFSVTIEAATGPPSLSVCTATSSLTDSATSSVDGRWRHLFCFFEFYLLIYFYLFDETEIATIILEF
jgi:hypothetical protein